ncbi:hypothetical protein ISF_06689 [Cordyceps fumosorosea ARSEF 2679]|uniref:Uncharacterized protein n=1 Tax=Cordyceps fumosorosea (strain ARSEF 2679) TaxID=1081104 RepID=A0A167R062_CORFA|nr:hypothetical protein ISF_06689 [Cordyceps fumosorosea ARSEF 2679]OAA58150.1 hypothetical protein ISF_06689 [Cordyceps fumosorosea ARSEF 2679]
MLAQFSIIGTLCLTLAAAKPLDMGDTITHTAAPTPTGDDYDPSDLVPANRAPGTLVPSVVPEEEARKSLPLGTAHGGALDLPPAPTAGPGAMAVEAATAAGNAYITVFNRHNAAITTVHVHGEGPAPKGNVGAGRLNKGQHGIFTVAHDWSGHVALIVAGKSVTTGDESLIEGSFKNQGHGFIGDINVSYVTRKRPAAPRTCLPSPTGLNPNGQGSCKNPNRGKGGVRSPTAFFKPCFYPGGAYTFDDDSAASSLNGRCPNEHYTCYVGAGCHA